VPSQIHFDVVPLSLSLAAVPVWHVYLTLGLLHAPSTMARLVHPSAGIPPLMPSQVHVYVAGGPGVKISLGTSTFPAWHEYFTLGLLHAPLMMSPLLHVVSLVPPQLPEQVQVDVVPLSASLVGVPAAHEYRNALQEPLTGPPAQGGSAMLHRPESAPPPMPSQFHVDVVPLSVSLAAVPGAHEYCEVSLHTPTAMSTLEHGPEGAPPARPSQIHVEVIPLSDSPTALPGAHEYLVLPHTPGAEARVVHRGRPEGLPVPRPSQIHVYDAGGPGTRVSLATSTFPAEHEYFKESLQTPLTALTKVHGPESVVVGGPGSPSHVHVQVDVATS
jgi:hypothetical protein